MKILEYGLMIWEVQPEIMLEAHHHNDIELIYLEHGTVLYQYHARPILLSAGDLIVFWAAIPHQLKELIAGLSLER